MIRIDMYQFGAGYRVRFHHHAGEPGTACNDGCDEDTVERAYPARHANVKETRRVVVEALARILKSTGHVEFLRLLADDPHDRMF